MGQHARLSAFNQRGDANATRRAQTCLTHDLEELQDGTSECWRCGLHLSRRDWAKRRSERDRQEQGALESAGAQSCPSPMGQAKTQGMITLSQLQKEYFKKSARLVEITDPAEARKQILCKCTSCWGAGQRCWDTGWVRLAFSPPLTKTSRSAIMVCREEILDEETKKLLTLVKKNDMLSA